MIVIARVTYITYGDAVAEATGFSGI